MTPPPACGCAIIGRGNALEFTHHEIDYCPTHLAAFDMLEALRYVVCSGESYERVQDNAERILDRVEGGKNG